jgi:glucose-1-phosphate adenylyltransferase
MASLIMTDSAGRNKHETLSLILAGGKNKALNILTGCFAKPATPFAGKYRLIDFVLSNLVNSNLDHLAILTQFNSQSIIEHVKAIKFCGQNQMTLPEFQIWEPSLERTGHENYLGTADAVYQNRDFILKSAVKVKRQKEAILNLKKENYKQLE